MACEDFLLFLPTWLFSLFSSSETSENHCLESFLLRLRGHLSELLLSSPPLVLASHRRPGQPSALGHTLGPPPSSTTFAVERSSSSSELRPTPPPPPPVSHQHLVSPGWVCKQAAAPWGNSQQWDRSSLPILGVQICPGGPDSLKPTLWPSFSLLPPPDSWDRLPEKPQVPHSVSRTLFSDINTNPLQWVQLIPAFYRGEMRGLRLCLPDSG